MLFQVENRRDARSTHCGVLEFIADEGMVYMPYWVSYQTFSSSLTFHRVGSLFQFMKTVPLTCLAQSCCMLARHAGLHALHSSMQQAFVFRGVLAVCSVCR